MPDPTKTMTIPNRPRPQKLTASMSTLGWMPLSSYERLVSVASMSSPVFVGTSCSFTIFSQSGAPRRPRFNCRMQVSRISLELSPPLSVGYADAASPVASLPLSSTLTTSLALGRSPIRATTAIGFRFSPVTTRSTY